MILHLIALFYVARVSRFAGLVNKDDTSPTLFEYPVGKSSSDYEAPADYEPQFAGFENLNADQLSEMNTLCGEDYVSLTHTYTPPHTHICVCVYV